MLLSNLWALPPALLALISNFPIPSTAQDLDPIDHPRDVKYYPNEAAVVRRELNIQQRLQQETPVAMRKMSGDPGEKFFLDYWIFEGDQDSTLASYANASLSAFANSFPLHFDHNGTSILPRFLGLERLSILARRGYQCPYGTSACSGINRPNVCCAVGSTCQIIEDTGLGDVGCCPAEQTCGGSVSQCPDGYSSCPNNPGGGCCVPGYGCVDNGCVQTSTAVVNPPPQPSASTTTVTIMTTVTESGGGVRTLTTTVIVDPVPVPPPTPTSISTTEVITSTTDTTTTTTPTYICPTDFRSCPESLGGGCCHTDRACGSGRSCPALTTSGSLEPPQRPTDDVTTTTFSTIPGVGCPTGFYACSAYYEGGCCQIDRNCDKTSCPTLASTTLVSNPTIVAPTGSGITAPGDRLTGACAGGWFTCAPAQGGGCCPSGYTCGPAQCSATGPGGQTAVAGKIAPNAAGLRARGDGIFGIVAVVISSVALGLGMFL
jgi:progranulin